MKNFDYKKRILFLGFIILIVLSLASCNASRKNVSIQKSHVDSSVVETKNNTHVSNIDSAVKKTANKTYQKTTVIHFEPIEIDSDYYIVDTVPLIIKNKAGKQKIYLPATTITETGNIAKSDSTHLIKNNDSTIQEQKAVKVISDKKEVVKKKFKIGWSWWYLLALIPLVFLFPDQSKKVAEKIKNVFKWLKLQNEQSKAA